MHATKLTKIMDDTPTKETIASLFSLLVNDMTSTERKKKRSLMHVKFTKTRSPSQDADTFLCVYISHTYRHNKKGQLKATLFANHTGFFSA